MSRITEENAFNTGMTPHERRVNLVDLAGEMRFLAHRIGRIEWGVLGILLALLWLIWTIGSKADEITAALRACT